MSAVTGEAGRFADGRGHLGQVCGKLRPLGDDCSVELFWKPSAGAHHLDDTAQQRPAVYAFKGRVGGREVAAHVAEPGRAKERAGDGVQEDIAV